MPFQRKKHIFVEEVEEEEEEEEGQEEGLAHSTKEITDTLPT